MGQAEGVVDGLIARAVSPGAVGLPTWATCLSLSPVLALVSTGGKRGFLQVLHSLPISLLPVY